MAAARQRSGLIRLLLGNGADIETRDKSGRRALHLAAGKWTVTVVRDLLDQNADIEAQDNLGRRPLIWAVRGRDARIVEMLLNMGADVATKDDLGGREVHPSVGLSETDVIILLTCCLREAPTAGKVTRTGHCYWVPLKRCAPHLTSS